MSNEWKSINITHFWMPMGMFVLGIMMGFVLGYRRPNTPQKEYPINVQCYWDTDGFQSYPKMECDSIKGDTLWKDGNMIVTKNIINVSFK